MRHSPPGYPVSSYCTSCGRDFAGNSYFDQHRTGVHEYTYSEGLTRDPLVEDGRRCMTPEEMLEAGLRLMSDDEMRSSSRHRHRAGFGVELWHDPAEVERTREALSALRRSREKP